MPKDKSELSILVLHIVLGVVILIESLIVAVDYQAVAASSHIGLPSQFVLVLAGAEVIGALLFLIPPTLKIGAIILLAVFAVAAVVHILHGQYNVGDLAIYAAGVVAVMNNRRVVKNDE